MPHVNLCACHTLSIGVHEQKIKEKQLSSGSLPFESSKFPDSLPAGYLVKMSSKLNRQRFISSCKRLVLAFILMTKKSKFWLLYTSSRSGSCVKISITTRIPPQAETVTAQNSALFQFWPSSLTHWHTRMHVKKVFADFNMRWVHFVHPFATF